MTTARDIVVYQGQMFELSLPYAGTAGRGQRMHIRTATATATVVQILTYNGDANARVLFDGTDAIDITIGASFSDLWIVGADRVEWVYDIEDYSLADDDDVVITHRGKCIVYGNRTRASDVTPSPQMPSGDGRYVRFDTDAQGLSDAQKLAARTNIGAGTGGGGSSDHGTLTGLADDDHTQYALADGSRGTFEAAGAVSTHNGVTTAHGISAFGATLVDDADASTARTTLGLGTAATSATGDFAAASHNHAASAITSGTIAHERGGLEADVSAYSGLVKIAAGATSAVTVTAAGEALLDDADAAAQRATLGLVIGTNVQAYDADLTTWAGVTPGTGIATALAVNVGTAGAPVINGGALGTPASGSLENCTGYPAASTTASGVVELLTTAEVNTGTDTTRAMTAASRKDSTPYYVDRAADWTLALTDRNADQWFNNGASALVCTIPLNATVAFAIGDTVPLVRLASGTATIDAATSVTLNGVSGGSCTIQTQYQGALLKKIGTDSWIVSGDVSAVA